MPAVFHEDRGHFLCVRAPLTFLAMLSKNIAKLFR